MKNNPALQTIEIGNFEVKSGSIAIGDPCYTRGRIDLVFEKLCVNGTWTALVLLGEGEAGWGRRIHELVVTLGEVDFSKRRFGVVFVDSGQMSVFDSSVRPDEPGDYKGPSFYHDCCIANEEGPGGIVLGAGVVCSSEYGDGAYNVYLARNEKGLVVGVKVRFI